MSLIAVCWSFSGNLSELQARQWFCRRHGASIRSSLFAAKFYDVPFEDICPDIPGAPRCEELQAWLRKHPEVMRYVVLDDDDDCLDELPLFQPSSKTGLTPEIAKGIEDYLAGRSDKDMRANALKRLGQNIHAIFSRDKS
jgi:HAD domain in Swiss Army Knife RNA repair proteins